MKNKIFKIIYFLILLLFLTNKVLYAGNCIGSCFGPIFGSIITLNQGENNISTNPQEPVQQTLTQNVDPSNIASTSRTTPTLDEYYEDPLHNETDYNQVLSQKIIVSHNQADKFSNMIISIFDTLLTDDLHLDLSNINESAKALIDLRYHFNYALESNIQSRMPRTSFKLYSYCDEIIQTNIENQSLMTFIDVQEEYEIANFYCRSAIFLTATNYFLKEINQNNDIFQAIVGKIKNNNFKKIEYSQKLNNSLNHLTPIINEMRIILLEDEQLKFEDLKLRAIFEEEMKIEKFNEKISELMEIKISLKQNEVDFFTEILFSYFNKLIKYLEGFEFNVKNLINVNNLKNLYKKIDNKSNKIGIYLTKILKDKIEIDCNKLIINENETEENNKNDKKIIEGRQLCKIGMFMSLGNFLNKKLLKFENKMIVEDEIMINNSITLEFNPTGTKEKLAKRKEKIVEINEKILKYNNEFIPFWNKTKNILIENDIINEENYKEIKTQIEKLSIEQFNRIFKSMYAISN